MITPYRGYILVKSPTQERQSAGGIILPGKHKQKITWGTVIAVGPPPYHKGKERPTIPAKKGDILHFKPFTGKKYRDKDFNKDLRMLLFVAYEDTLCVEKVTKKEKV